MKMKLSTFQEWRLNFNWGMLAFVLHRITGLALVLYIFGHLWSISHSLAGNAYFNKMMGLYNTHIGHVVEWFLLLAVLWHLFNGLRITATDFLRFTHQQKRLVIWVFVVSAIIAFAALPKFIPWLFTGFGGVQ